MKDRKIIAVFACVMLAFFALGLADVLHMAGPTAGGEAEKDRLIGVFITREHLDLFDVEGYLNDRADRIFTGGGISAQEMEPYQGRLYATLVETPGAGGETRPRQEFIFEGVDGIRYFFARYADEEGSYYGSSGEDAVSDEHTEISSTDSGDYVSLEGTVYISAASGPTVFYYNPVYQTAQGAVYAVTGSGMSYGGEVTSGMSGNWELKEEDTSTVGDKTTSAASCVKVNVCFMDTPVGTAIVQFDQENKILSRKEYPCGGLPERLTVEPGTEYLFVETRLRDSDGRESLSRELYQPDAESLYAFYCGEDGICAKQFCSIDWNA